MNLSAHFQGQHCAPLLCKSSLQYYPSLLPQLGQILSALQNNINLNFSNAIYSITILTYQSQASEHSPEQVDESMKADLNSESVHQETTQRAHYTKRKYFHHTTPPYTQLPGCQLGFPAAIQDEEAV